MRFAIVAFLCLLCIEPALAVDKSKARDLYRRGTQHYNLAEYDKALDAFKEAYRNFEDPIFLFNIGQCERQLGHKEEAVRLYRSYLRNAPEAPNKTEVSDIILRLEDAIAREKTAERPVTPPPTTAAESNPVVVPPVAQPTTRDATRPLTEPRADRPLYKRWWLWTAVGVVAAGAAVGLAVGLTQKAPAAPTTTTDLGNYHF